MSESPEDLRNCCTVCPEWPLCQVQPTELRPVHFKITLKFHSHSSSHFLGTQSYVQYSDSVRNDLYSGESLCCIYLTSQYKYESAAVSIRGNDVVTSYHW